MGAWVVGHNYAGYLPESPTYAIEDREDAVNELESIVIDYSDADADTEHFPEHAATMFDTFEAMCSDGNGPRDTGGDWFCHLTDANGHLVSFWIQWCSTRYADEDED